MLEMTVGPQHLCSDRTAASRRDWVLTASIGFSVANLEILAMSSFRFSGGNMLSNHADPLFSIPPTEP